MTEEQKIDFLLSRGVEEVISENALKEKLKKGHPLRIKYGIDPTTKDFHFGYLVALRKLRFFQKLGHKVIMLIGGFTARFGDPSAKLKTRKLRPKEDVAEQAQAYLDQIKKILDIDEIEIRDNSEWYDKMSAEELLKLAANFSHAQLIERDMFQERIKNNQRIGVHELFYPTLQAYDSVVLKADVALGGLDQKFNELLGRELQKQSKQVGQEVMLLKTLPGTDGKEKMSQSLNNTISLDSEPKDQFSKIMSIPDDIIFNYFEMLTDIPEKELIEMKDSFKKTINPRDLKIKLAQMIVSEIWGKEKACEAENYFVQVFSKGKVSEVDIETQKIEPKTYLAKDLLIELGLVKSKSEAIRLISQHAVEINKKIIADPLAEISPQGGEIVRVGKYRFKKIEL